MQGIVVAIVLGLATALAVRSSNKPRDRSEADKNSIPSTPLAPRKRMDAPAAVKTSAQEECSSSKRTLKGRAWVIDGDSLKIAQTEVRLWGVDAPEINHP
jgi:endonuclease YncB( thermonuclease family)